MVLFLFKKADPGTANSWPFDRTFYRHPKRYPGHVFIATACAQRAIILMPSLRPILVQCKTFLFTPAVGMVFCVCSKRIEEENEKIHENIYRENYG